MRTKNGIIAVNEQTGEVRKFDSGYAFAKELGCKPEVVNTALRLCTCVKGWRLYDTEAGIRKKIAELKERMEFVKSLEEKL